MSALAAKLSNPAYWTQTWAGICRNAQLKYSPMLRDNSATPLFHGMLLISAVMYTGTYISRVYGDVQHDRQIKRTALAEYYERHGGAPHH